MERSKKSLQLIKRENKSIQNRIVKKQHQLVKKQERTELALNEDLKRREAEMDRELSKHANKQLLDPDTLDAPGSPATLTPRSGSNAGDSDQATDLDACPDSCSSSDGEDEAKVPQWLPKRYHDLQAVIRSAHSTSTSSSTTLSARTAPRRLPSDIRRRR